MNDGAAIIVNGADVIHDIVTVEVNIVSVVHNIDDVMDVLDYFMHESASASHKLTPVAWNQGI